MTYTNNLEIEHIGSGLVNRTLSKSEWTHSAHFAAAIWLLAHDEYDAFRDMPGFIRRYNETTGVPNTDTDGYHETITLASLRAAKHVSDKSAGLPLHMIVNELLASEFGKSAWLFDYWSKEVLFSAEARQVWVEPDVKALGF